MVSFSIDSWCERHGISRAFFYKLKAEGKAPKTFNIGKLVRITRAADEAWLAERARRSMEVA